MIQINTRELKKDARHELTGHHGYFAGMVLAVAACNMGLSYLVNYAVPSTENWINLILYFACSLLTNMAYYIILSGYMNMYLRLCRHRKLQVSDLWVAFSNHPEHIALYSVVQFILETVTYNGGYWLLGRIRSASGLSGIITLIIAGLLAALLLIWIQMGLSMVLFVYCDTPYLNAWDLIRESWKITRGYRGKIFYLYLSFLGLMALSLLSFGFGFMFVYPYLYTTLCLFYLNIHRRTDE